MGCPKLHTKKMHYSTKDVQGLFVGLKKSDAKSYRYGFNGQEREDEIAGEGNHNTALFWEYDTRLGSRWNLDPVVKEYESGYSCFGNNPISVTDINGDDSLFFNSKGEQISSSKCDNTFYFAQDKDGNVKHKDNNYRMGLSYSSLFCDENKEGGAQRYKRVITAPPDAISKNLLSKLTSNYPTLSIGNVLHLWFNSGPGGKYDYKNTVLAGLTDDDAIDIGGVLINRHEAGMFLWGYAAGKAYSGYSKNDGYLRLSRDNKWMHLSVEGNSDEWGEVFAWSWGYMMCRNSSMLTVQADVEQAMKSYYNNKPYKLELPDYNSPKQRPKRTWYQSIIENKKRGMFISR
jgi:hypothetical protein